MNCEEVLDIFTPRLEDFGHVCIAGGAARDELMGVRPQDYDVFVLWQRQQWDYAAAKAAVLAQVEDLAKIDPAVEWHNSEPFLVDNFRIGGARVQILVSPEQSLDSLIYSFDWNICMFGQTKRQRIQGMDPKEISPGKELRLNRVTYPKSTLRRGFRFSERFLMKLRDEDLGLLCHQIITPKPK